MHPPENRLSAISADNHQPWLWFIHVFLIIFVLLGAGMRVWMKWKNAALADALLLSAHILYIGYWIVILFALMSSLGKSDGVSDRLQENRAAKLVFGSRLLLVVILSITKISTISLIREIFTRSATKWWFRVIAAAAIVQALAGCLIISVNCSPTATLDGAANDRCPGNVPRWIAFTAVEATLEVSMVIPVTMTVMRLQTNLQRKLWAITVFLCRLVVWIPLWMHLSFYIRFHRSGRTNIDIVSSIITEELWVAFALVSASTPVVMRVAKKFTTSGITLNTTPQGSRLTSSNPRSTVFRPDNVTNTSQVDAHKMKSMNEDGSIGSNAESHVGILRQVEFLVSSERR